MHWPTSTVHSTGRCNTLEAAQAEEVLQMNRYLDTVPHPWNYAVIEAAIFKNFKDARTAIEDTQGGRLWRSLQELDDSVYVLDMNISDLLDEISIFSNRSKNPAFWHQGDGSEAERYTREAKRKLSNCTAAHMALVDHARNFTRASPVPEYTSVSRIQTPA